MAPIRYTSVIISFVYRVWRATPGEGGGAGCSLEMGDKRKQMQDQFDHRVLLLEQQEVLMLGLGGRLTAPRHLSSRDDEQSAASLFRENLDELPSTCQ